MFNSFASLFGHEQTLRVKVELNFKFQIEYAEFDFQSTDEGDQSVNEVMD